MPLVREESGRNTSAVALLLIDVINDLDFDSADELLVQALPMAKKIAALKRQAAQRQIPVVYVNDNSGQWKSDFRHTVEHCCADNSRGGENLTGAPARGLRLFRAKAKTLRQRRSMSCSNI